MARSAGSATYSIGAGTVSITAKLAPAAQVDPFVGQPARPVFDDPSASVGAREIEDRLDGPPVLERAEQPLAISVARLRGTRTRQGTPPARRVGSPPAGMLHRHHRRTPRPRPGAPWRRRRPATILLETHPAVAVAVDVPGHRPGAPAHPGAGPGRGCAIGGGRPGPGPGPRGASATSPAMVERTRAAKAVSSPGKVTISGTSASYDDGSWRPRRRSDGSGGIFGAPDLPRYHRRMRQLISRQLRRRGR